MKKRICPDCKKPTISNSMYSEDGASVLDEVCESCGKRQYYYIGYHDGKSAWDLFDEKYALVEVAS